MDYKKIVPTWVKGNELVFWRIVGGDGEQVAKILDENTTEDESLARLAMNLDLLPTGIYKIYGRKRKQDANGENAYSFYVPEKPEDARVMGASSEVSKLSKLEERLAKYEIILKEKEIEDKLKAQAEKYEKKIEKLQEQRKEPDIIERLTGLFGMLHMQNPLKQFAPTNQVTGHPQENQQTEVTSETASETVSETANNIIRTSLKQMRDIFENDESFLAFMQTAGNIAQYEPQKFKILLQYMQPPKAQAQPQEEPQPQYN